MWHSSFVRTRVNNRNLVTITGSKYRLVGPMSIILSLKNGKWKENDRDKYNKKESKSYSAAIVKLKTLKILTRFFSMIKCDIYNIT